MTVRRTVLRVERLGGRVLPSASVASLIPTAAAAVTVQTTTGSAWTGQGRFTIATNRTTAAKTYTLDGSTNFGTAGHFAVTGSVTTVGNRAGQATGRVMLSSPRGTLTLALTGATQAANSGLPASISYKVVSGSGFFSRYSGQGTFKLAPALFPGYADRGHFTASATAPVGTVPTTPPPVQTTTGPSWAGQGRFTVTSNPTTRTRTYAFRGSADFGRDGFFAVGGTIQTVGNVASGKATGRITLSDRRGTLVLALTGPTQSRNAGLPTTYTYTVVSGTGYFARYVGRGTVQLSAPFYPAYNDRGHFQVAVRPTSK